MCAGNKSPDDLFAVLLQPGDVDDRQTFTSHMFVARDNRVEGKLLTVESCLFTDYVGVPVRKGEPIVIEFKGRCTDMNGECANWSRRGECLRNPSYMLKNCRVSCGTCEEKEEGEGRGRNGPRRGEL